jgi:hypothetical protein
MPHDSDGDEGEVEGIEGEIEGDEEGRLERQQETAEASVREQKRKRTMSESLRKKRAVAVRQLLGWEREGAEQDREPSWLVVTKTGQHAQAGFRSDGGGMFHTAKHKDEKVGAGSWRHAPCMPCAMHAMRHACQRAAGY